MIQKQLVLILIFFPSIALAQTEWKIQASSQVTFKIKNAGFNVSGTFGGLEGKLVFSPDRLNTSNIEASIETQTIDTQNNARDKHLRKDDYFYVEKYPKIKMKSKRFARSKSGDFIGYFDLTIREVTKEVKIPFKFSQEGEKAIFKGSIEINRRDFNVGGGSLILSNKVEIFLDIQVNQ